MGSRATGSAVLGSGEGRVRRDFGDWPTPPALAAAVVAALGREGRFERVLEPTCGRGNFLAAVLESASPPGEVRGVEIQPALAEACRDLVGTRGHVLAADLFRVDLARDLDWSGGGRLLVVGNPPWVTASSLGGSGGRERNPGPARRNALGLGGLAAMTGRSNFDLAEAVVLKLVEELADQRPTIALLVKASVARALARAVPTRGLPVVRVEFRRVDAARWFGAAVEAGLLIVEVGPGPRADRVAVFDDLAAPAPSAEWGIGPDGSLVADRSAYDRAAWLDGAGPIPWRAGVKHDAADVVELIPDGPGTWRNGLGERVDVEAERVYPWFKATDLARPAPDGSPCVPRRSAVVPQLALGDDPADLAATCPRLWDYLNRHAARFARRRSAIYRGRPPFSLFGVGPYTFSPYKVAVSALHKDARFRALGPVGGRPPLVDDTCYFLPLATGGAACLVAALLNGPEAGDLLRGLSFRGNKRPVTQALLRRIDLDALRRRAEPTGLAGRVRAERAALPGAVDGPIGHDGGSLARFAWPIP